MKLLKSLLAVPVAALLFAAVYPAHATDPGSTNDVGAPAPDNSTPAGTNAVNAVSVNYTIDASTLTTQGARLNRDGVQATCAAPKTTSIFASGSFRYVASAPLYNTSSSPVCATITATPDPACDANIFPVAYLGSFEPNNVLTNYLGDPGYSFGVPPSGPLSFSVTVPGNSAIVVDLMDVDGTGSCTVTLSSPELTASGTVIASYVPVPGLRNGIALLLGLGLFGIVLVTLKRRRASR